MCFLDPSTHFWEQGSHPTSGVQRANKFNIFTVLTIFYATDSFYRHQINVLQKATLFTTKGWFHLASENGFALDSLWRRESSSCLPLASFSDSISSQHQTPIFHPTLKSIPSFQSLEFPLISKSFLKNVLNGGIKSAIFKASHF